VEENKNTRDFVDNPSTESSSLTTENKIPSKNTGFKGLSFKNPPVSRSEYNQAYEEYVRRCSI